jgi:hypothetical protein
MIWNCDNFQNETQNLYTFKNKNKNKNWLLRKWYIGAITNIINKKL